jgi:hypothetical protein
MIGPHGNRVDRTRPPAVAEKECLRCGKTKPRSEFSVQRKEPDGLQDWCKDCYTTYYQDRVASQEAA